LGWGRISRRKTDDSMLVTILSLREPSLAIQRQKAAVNNDVYARKTGVLRVSLG
jgi:hypothetical protein